MAWCELKGLDYAERVTSTMVSIWESAVRDVPLEGLHGAMKQYLATASSATFWPTPGDVLKLYRDAAAELGWEKAERRLREWHYDPGVDGGPWMPVFRAAKPKDWSGEVVEHNGGFLLYPEPLDRATEHAVAIVGGWGRLRAIGGKDRDFARKDYLRAHREAPEVLKALPASDTSRLLGRMPTELVAKALKGIA